MLKENAHDLFYTVYATTGGSPYVYRNFMVCTQRMGDNKMRRPRVIGRAY